ncbi:hypothetical protein EON83_30725 [bacterium]|nr:MAG: hypothetical protein EON83_30725 [bacterium]
MATALHPLTAQKLHEEARPLKERIAAWQFFNVYGVKTTTIDGKQVAISGVKFEGSPKHVFWSGFFEPFMVAAANNTFQWLGEQCIARNLNPSTYFEEARQLMHALVSKSFQEIAQTDQILRGEGFPSLIQLVDVSAKIASMNQHIDSLAIAFQHRQPTPLQLTSATEDIIELKPNIGGIGLNLNALFRWARARFSKNS